MVKPRQANSTPLRITSILELSPVTSRAAVPMPPSAAKLLQSIRQNPASPGRTERLWLSSGPVTAIVCAGSLTESVKPPTASARAVRFLRRTLPTSSTVPRHRRRFPPSTFGFTQFKWRNIWHGILRSLIFRPLFPPLLLNLLHSLLFSLLLVFPLISLSPFLPFRSRLRGSLDGLQQQQSR